MNNTKQEIMTIVRTLTHLKLTSAQQDSFLHDLSKLLTKWELEGYQLNEREQDQLSNII